MRGSGYLWVLAAGFGMALLLPVGVGAESVSIPVTDALAVQMEITRPWEVFRQAPEFLVKETAEHLEHEAAAQGKSPGEKEIRRTAEKRLAANEAFVCKPAAGACLTVDFSPLKSDELPPSAKTVALSAKYAGEGLAEEEGVTGLEQKSRRVTVPGADVAYRVDAQFQLHEEPRQFIGVIGFVNPQWFFLYYSDPRRDPGAAGEMERMLESLSVRPQGGK